MTAYNQIIGRNTNTNGDELSLDPIQIPEQVSRVILQETVKQSAILNLARTEQMSARTQRMPAIDMFPTAVWLDGAPATAAQEDVALKQTTTMKWKNITMEAREIAVMVPVSDNYVADSGFDLLGMIAPRIGEAIGFALDSACLFDVNNPWSDHPYSKGIYQQAVAAGNYVVAGHNIVGGPDNGNPSDAYYNIAELGGKLADLGFNMDGAATKIGYEWELAQARTSTGSGLFANAPGLSPNTPVLPYGLNYHPVNNGSWNATLAKAIVGDWSKALVGIRQDVTMKVFDSGIIQDGSGATVYNAMQQDGKILRVTARFAFATLAYKTITHQGSDAYPFAVLHTSGSAPTS